MAGEFIRGSRESPSMVVLTVLVALLGAVERPYTSPKDPKSEYGYGISAQEARDGWVSLFDGEKITTAPFGDYELKVTASNDGEVLVGASGSPVKVRAGTSVQRVQKQGLGPVRVGKGLRVTALAVRPLNLKPLMAGWKEIPHPSRPGKGRWEPIQNGLRAVGGPACVELPGDYRDFVLQLTVQNRKPLSNGGVFFRCKAGEFLNGYEAQVFNGCYDHDPAQPAEYATGAIDDRQNARRVVARDGEPFTMTIVAVGPHLATWVNGVQVTDWTDDRPADDNPRQGKRTKPGPIQLQAHDKDTDVEYRDIRIVPLN
jgi:hypothetical protein